MVFESLFKKENQKPAADAGAKFAQKPVQQMQKPPAQQAQKMPVPQGPKIPAQQAQKTAENPLNMPDFGNDFEDDMTSPEKLLADEIFEPQKNAPQAQAIAPKAAPKPAQTQNLQKIPAFVSLDKYKEIRLALRDIKSASAEMRKTIENLRQNRDGGTTLLNTTISGLERIEGNIDQIRTVLRT